MFTFLLVVHALIAAALVTVILMQRSEGGGLGMGGGPAGLMTARGAADFLTRATAVLATLFVLMAFLLAVLAARRDSAGQIDTSLAHQAPVGPITAPTPITPPIAPVNGIPMMGTPAPQTTAPKLPRPSPPLQPRPAAPRRPHRASRPSTPARSPMPRSASAAFRAATPSMIRRRSRRSCAPAHRLTTKPTPTLDLAPPAPAAGNGSSQPQ